MSASFSLSMYYNTIAYFRVFIIQLLTKPSKKTLYNANNQGLTFDTVHFIV
jgi:hypothetical protein